MLRFHHELLARVRTELNLTQEAAAAAVGVDVRTYRRYESGAVNEAAEGFVVRNASRRRLLAALSRELGIAESELVIEARATEPAPAPAGWRPCHAHTLPRARHFVGREEALALLRAPTRGVIAVVAIGGAGKTALVERMIAELGEGPHAGGLLVWSFYDDTRVEAFFAAATRYFAEGAEVPAGERPQRLQEALASGPPHVLVIDGIEVLQGSGREDSTYGRIADGSLRRLLMSAARGLGAARVVLTSRFEPTDLQAWDGAGLTTLRLGGLSPAEGSTLLEHWGLSAKTPLRPLVDRVGGHALSVAMLGSYAGMFLGGDGERAQAIALEPAARDDVQARRLLAVLAAYAAALGPEERDLVARLALFPAGADVELLARLASAGGAVAGALAGRDAAAIGPIVARLERLGLVARAGPGRYTAHPFVAEYFRSLLGAPPAAIHEVERAHLIARLDVHRPGPHADERLETYEALLLHTLRAGRTGEAASIYFRSLGGFSHLGLQLGAMSRGARIVREFAPGGDPARMTAALEPGRRARLVYDWGLYAGALGDLAQASRCYRIHGALVREAGNLEGLTTSLRALAYTERLAGALSEALALTEAAVEVASRAEAPGDVARGLALQARVLHDLGRVGEAEACFEKARAMGDRPFARRSFWAAEHALGLGRGAAARAEIEGNLEGLHELGWAGHRAHAETILGALALAEEEPDPDRASVHLGHARAWTTASGEVEVVLRCHALEAQICLAERRLADAARVIHEGRMLAETCGFGLFVVEFSNLGLTRALAAERGIEEATAQALTAARGRPSYAWGLADALHLAGLARGTGGRELLAQAATLRAALQHPQLAATRAALERAEK
ncbi:helix-turn-helix domain-containing protein [Nannocystis bainbridge]|uniref:Helix-turn-helix transcriptional regulator n=1 Tax=Nannocystis bainbridge TaxID=2995303 RepID=A0ABT5E9G9_9BACT|nr:helix-turn-helix transcriptional regulator [Nannocystis bainbridge]MDC0721989.1 helix-turn-helix transcriptional regulator [Nannocystis bainbridge]